jgi:FecR protein
MSQNTSIQLRALTLALASIYPLQALANAGTAQFSIGDVTVQRAAASTPLTSGNRVESGDLITTGSAGRTQLRFTDGGMVSLQPNSQFKISRYADAGDGKQDSFLVDLARGGMRALTGLIGKRNRDNYKVTTSTATIGIRGSGFSMAYNEDGTLGVTTEQDAIEVCTQAGCIGLNLGESALVTSASALPTRTRERAHWNPPHPRRLITARNDDVDDQGKARHIPRQLTARLFTDLAYIGAGIDTNGGADQRSYANGTANALGADFRGYLSQNGNRGSGGTTNILSSSGNYANGDFIALGTWENSVWDNGSVQTTLLKSAFVMGQPTPIPPAGLASLFPQGATYTMNSATPVFSSTSVAGVMDYGYIHVNFNNVLNPIGINLGFTFAGSPGPNSQPAASPTSYYATGSGSPTGAGFSVPLTINGGLCSSGYCFGNAQGFFVGTNAQNAGLSFTGAMGYVGLGNVSGAATLVRGTLFVGE